MNQATETRTDIAADIVSLTAEATELESRIDEIHLELAHLKERMGAVSAALHRILPT